MTNPVSMDTELATRAGTLGQNTAQDLRASVQKLITLLGDNVRWDGAAGDAFRQAVGEIGPKLPLVLSRLDAGMGELLTATANIGSTDQTGTTAIRKVAAASTGITTSLNHH
jgi:hypothetical protein